MPIKIIEADVDNDIAILESLLNRNRCVQVDRRRFEWLYLENPRGKARAWYVIDEKTEEPIAFTCVLPRMVRVDGEDILCWNCGDFSVDMKYRTLGVAIKLRREAKNAVDKGVIAALYAHPNKKMQVIHQRVGHTCIGKMKRYAKIIKADKYVKRYIKYKIPAKGLSSLINTGLMLKDHLLVQKNENYSTEWITGKRFSSEYNELFNELSKYYKILGERTSSYLNWRYEDNPLYSSSRITIRRNGVLQGYIIFTKGEDLSVNIKDMFCIPDGKIIKTMLHELFSGLRKDKMQSVSFVVKENNPLITILQETGFRLRPDDSLIYAHAGEEKQTLKAMWLDGDNWFMTVGDRDV